jgi:phosphoribosylamine--glycine ligase
MIDAGVPTAQARVCLSINDVSAAMSEFGAPFVIKEDGLAAGKGVIVTSNRDAAMAHAAECFAKPDGAVVVEEFLDGPEVSLFAITDGTHVLALQPAQDFKRAGDGDSGPNTGGMGAYSPLPWAPADLIEEVTRTVLGPTVDAMRDRGTPFTGLLYAGLALTSRGIRVIEFNARFGDPETQVVLARLRTPLAGVLYAAATGTLSEVGPLEWSPDAAVTVVLASHGYPESPRTGDPIHGLAVAGRIDGVEVFHAGTATGPDGQICSAGGRVLSVTAHGVNLLQARDRAYAALELIDLEGAHYRSDIAELAARTS